MNDTANTALKAGRLLVGTNDSEDRLCGMHVFELVINHASGFVQRRKAGEVSDEFPECKDLMQERAKDAAKQVSDRHAKGRIAAFNKYCKENLHYLPIKILMGNKTRVAGTFRMSECLLRNHHALMQFLAYQRRRVAMGQDVEDGFNLDNFLGADEWQQLAEFVAIYEKTTSLAIALQADMAGSLSIAKLQLTDCIADLCGTPQEGAVPFSPYKVNNREVVFDVVIVNDADKTWTPQRPFKDLPRRKMCLPLELPKPDHPDIEDDRLWNVDGKDTLLPTMTQASRKLITRLMKETDFYFKKTTDDERVCMFLNPFVKVFGIMHLCSMKFFGDDFETLCKEKTLQDLFLLFGPDLTAIRDQVEKDHNEAVEREKAHATETMQAVATAGPISPVRTTYQMMRRKLAMPAPKPARTAQHMSLADKQQQRVAEETTKFNDETKRELQDYGSHLQSLLVTTDETTEVSSSFRWMNLIKKFPTLLAKQEMEEHGEGVTNVWDANDCPFNTVYSTKRFDLIGWWMHKDHGGRWKLLQALAMIHLGQPFTNAAVERAFSRTTWVDAARAQRVLDCTFEMRVLDAANRAFVQKTKPLLDEKKAFQESSTALEKVVKKFTTPIVWPSYPKKAKAAKTTSDVAVSVEDDEISVIAGTTSDDDGDELESDDGDSVESVVPEQDDSIARQVGDQAFIDEMAGLLKTKSKKPPPSATTKKAPPSSSTSSKKRKASTD
jgi:hAT family C-terminal dimerisation region